MRKILTHNIFSVLSKVVDELQVEAFLVGGFVRDLILERPSKDIDIMVLGSGIDFAKRVADHIGKPEGLKVFANFGTAMLHYDGLEIEFVGARKESYRRDSRKPIVEDGTFEDDIFRRDFTINALTISLSSKNFGELSDLTGGTEDIKNKIIKTPLSPAQTFSDDPLRMMRAVRFATQLGFLLHDDVYNGIMQNKERIEIISIERITDELNKIIMSPKPSIGFEYLFNTGLLAIIFPEMQKLQGVDVVKGKGHKDNFYHTLKVLDNIALHSDNLWLRWAALLHDIAKPATKRFVEHEGWTFHSHEFIGEKMIPGIFKKLKLPLQEHMKYVQKLVRLHLRPIALVESNITDSAVRRLLFEAGETIDDLMLLCEADITSKNELKVKKYINNLNIVKRKLVEIEEKDKVREFQPPVSGEEIMSIFALNPSREVGLIKNAIKNAILDGEIPNNYEQALGFMINFAKSLNIYPQKK
ncbi:MAG: HD domain-containing protein [Bacteroidales bacterium]|nr:HD domain-containing protein [Bacteroidales bacterium]